MKPGADADTALVGHVHLGIDIGAVWSVVEQDLPGLSAALERMAQRCA